MMKSSSRIGCKLGSLKLVIWQFGFHSQAPGHHADDVDLPVTLEVVPINADVGERPQFGQREWAMAELIPVILAYRASKAARCGSAMSASALSFCAWTVTPWSIVRRADVRRSVTAITSGSIFSATS